MTIKQIIVTDVHNAMSLDEREAAMKQAIDRLEGGRPDHMRRLADCLRWVVEAMQDDKRTRENQGVHDLLHDYERQIQIHFKWIKKERPGLLDDAHAIRSIVARPEGQPRAKLSRAAEELEALAGSLEGPRWSNAMPKTQMADALRLTVRGLKDVHGDNINRVPKTRKRWRIRLDKLDSGERAAIENSTPPKGKPRGRTKSGDG